METKKAVEVSKRGGKKERKPFLYEFSGIKFPSHPKDLFRASLTAVNNGVVIWLESKKTKQQWQATVTDVGDCGPSGVPEEAVIAFMKNALELVIVGAEEETQKQSDQPTVDFEIQEGEVILVLTLSMGGVWKPEFIFTLLPVGLDKIDILEAKLRDAQEEIEALKAEKQENAVIYLSLSSQAVCGNQQFVQWNCDAPKIPSELNFVLSADCRDVVVVRAGVYQIQVRLAGTNSANTQSMGLQLNGNEIAQCVQSDANSHQNTAQIFEILELQVNSVLRVRCGMNNNSLGTVYANRFNILRLGNLD